MSPSRRAPESPAAIRGRPYRRNDHQHDLRRADQRGRAGYRPRMDRIPPSAETRTGGARRHEPGCAVGFCHACPSRPRFCMASLSVRNFFSGRAGSSALCRQKAAEGVDTSNRRSPEAARQAASRRGCPPFFQQRHDVRVRQRHTPSVSGDRPHRRVCGLPFSQNSFRRGCCQLGNNGRVCPGDGPVFRSPARCCQESRAIVDSTAFRWSAIRVHCARAMRVVHASVPGGRRAMTRTKKARRRSSRPLVQYPSITPGDAQ